MNVHARLGSLYRSPSVSLSSKLRTFPSPSSHSASFLNPSSSTPCSRRRKLSVTIIPKTKDRAGTLSLEIETSPRNHSWDFYQFVASLDYNIKLEPIHEIEQALFNAKKALEASNEAVSLYDKPTPQTIKEDNIVRSSKHLQRESRRRKGSTLNPSCSKSSIKEASNDLSIWEVESKQFLTYNEECELVSHVQELLKLEEVSKCLEAQFNRQPALAEWAKAVDLTTSTLKKKINCGQRSRERLIASNVRMVSHVAKSYQGFGVNPQDLIQAGTIGLMKSIEKFKTDANCRFSSYSYWWIKQSIRKTIFHHSRTVRLPDYVYGKLGKVVEAKRFFLLEGNHRPSKEDISSHMNITVAKLNKLLYETRMPLSFEQQVWKDQKTTFHDIIEDTRNETVVERKLMRQHICGLLGILKPKESLVVRLRYGLEDGSGKTLAEIGVIVGCSKEGVRKLQNRAIGKLRKCLNSHGLYEYKSLLI